MTTLHHSARTTVPGMEVQYLNVMSYFTDGNASLTVTDYSIDGRRESKATIYLSPEQWGELAVIAAEQAKKNLKDSGAEYLTHEQLEEARAEQARVKHEKAVVLALETLKRWSGTSGDYAGWFLPISNYSDVPEDILDELLEKGMIEIKQDTYSSGRPKVWYRITQNGQQ